MLSHVAHLSVINSLKCAGCVLLPATWQAVLCVDIAGFASKNKASPPYLKDAQKEKNKPTKSQKTDKIPRALGAYNFFIRDRSAALKQPGAKNTDLMKAAAQEWKTLTPAQKKPYEDLAAQSKAETAAAREVVKSNKAPPSAYNAWCSEVVKDLKSSNPNMKAPEMMREAAARWKVLPEPDKERRKAEAKDAKDAWSQQQQTGL